MKELHISVAPETLFHIGNISVTNSLLTTVIVFAILLVIALTAKPKESYGSKNKFAQLFEIAFEGLYSFIGKIAGKRTEAIFPLVVTFFLFIIFGNWIGLLPGVGSIGIYEHTAHGEKLIPLLRAPSADLNTTLALALISVSVTQALSIKSLGLGSYIKRFINFSNPINFFVGILEIISEFAKVLSFSFRLFGNIFAGEVLLAVMVFLIPVLVPVPFLILEVFVGFIQALVFTMLTTIFIVVATESHH